MTRAASLLLVPLAIVLFAPLAHAEETVVHVRVLSRGAKFIGTSMGGAHVTIRDAETGAILAEGLTKGGTGDTAKIMEGTGNVHASVATEKAALFEAKLDLEAPRRLRITARGPRAQAQSENEASATQWVVPGKHLTNGDGFVLELHGLVVDVLDPPAHLRFEAPGGEVRLRANVTMMCGCHLAPDGPWPLEAFEVMALVHRDGERIATLPMAYDGVPSQFRATFLADAPGTYDVTVYAFQAKTGNTGLDRTTLTVRAPKR